MRIILDSSALLAALLNEPGADQVARVIDSSLILAVNLAEVASGLVRNGATEVEARSALRRVAVTVISADEALAIDAGLMRPITDRAGLSLGDRFCFALARRLSAPVLTGDRNWTKVADAAGVEVQLIR